MLPPSLSLSPKSSMYVHTFLSNEQLVWKFTLVLSFYEWSFYRSYMVNYKNCATNGILLLEFHFQWNKVALTQYKVIMVELCVLVARNIRSFLYFFYWRALTFQKCFRILIWLPFLTFFFFLFWHSNDFRERDRDSRFFRKKWSTFCTLYSTSNMSSIVTTKMTTITIKGAENGFTKEPLTDGNCSYLKL